MPQLRPAALAAVTLLLGLTACRVDTTVDSFQATADVAAQGCRNRAGCRLVFTVEPSNTHAGAAIAPPVRVAVQDPAGNLVPDFHGAVTIALEDNPGQAHLSGARAAPVVGGIATFDNLRIDRPGRGYTLRASSGRLTPAVSVPFNIIGPVTQLEFTVQPTSTAAGAVITPAVFVAPLDAFGTPDSEFAGAITVAISINPADGSLSGTLIKAASPGGASFDDLSIDKVGSGYTLIATAAGVTSATSAPFDILTGAATQLVFTVHPSNATAGTSIAPAIEVSAMDPSGNIDVNFTGTVALSIAANPAAGVLSGTLVQAASMGVVRFADLQIDKAGSGYQLQATAGALIPAISAPFDILTGAATHLLFTAQPVTTVAGTVFPVPIEVTAQDDLGNTASGFSGPVTVAVTTGTGAADATLSGILTVTALEGVAVFSNLTIDKSGLGYTLTASASGLTGASSAVFDVTPALASQLLFTVHPTNTTAGNPIAPAVEVRAMDPFGNIDVNFTGTVALSIAANPAAGVLSGTLVQSASMGVVRFADLQIDKAGSGYQLQATAGALIPAISAPFDILTGAATHLAFTAQPVTTVAGTVFPVPIEVTAQDDLGNTASGFSGPVTVAVTTGTGAADATLSGILTVTALEGVAVFSDLTIDKSGLGYTLTASASGLTGASSAAFNVLPGPAAQLVFTTQPTNTAVGAIISPPVVVTAQDAFGNTATSFADNITLAFAQDPGGGTLSGTLIVSPVSGVATFSDVSIDMIGSGYQLLATASGLVAAASAPFDVF